MRQRCGLACNATAPSKTSHRVSHPGGFFLRNTNSGAHQQIALPLVFTGFVHAEPERPRKIGCGHQKLLLPSFSWAPTTSAPPATPANGSPRGTTEHQLGDVLSQHQTTPANSRKRPAPRDHRAPARGRSVNNIKQHPPTPANGPPPGTTEHQLGDVLSQHQTAPANSRERSAPWDHRAPARGRSVTTFGSSGALPQSGQRPCTTQPSASPRKNPDENQRFPLPRQRSGVTNIASLRVTTRDETQTTVACAKEAVSHKVALRM